MADKNEERGKTLRALFEEVDCNGDRLTEQAVKGSRIPNIICKLPGSEQSEIVVGAHFDKVARGKGVVDNWSGASLLPSFFQSLSSRPRRFTFVFIGFSDEEKGLIGSMFYMKQLAKEEKTRIRAMVNIDSLGLSSTKVWASRADKNLGEALLRVANSMQLPIGGVNVEQVGDSDSRAFVDNHIPSIDFHSITQETLAILHSPRDTMSAIRPDDYYESYRLLASFLAFLDVTLNYSAGGGPVQ